MSSVALAIAIVAVQTATGAGWWLIVRSGRRTSAAEALGMGLALGTFASMLSGVLLAGTPLAAVGWMLPTLGILITLLIPAARHRLTGARITWPQAESVALLSGLAVGIPLVALNWARVPLSAPTTESFADLYFFEAISRGLAEFGPSQSILMAGGSLRYHWFAYGWAGELAQVAGTAPFVVITRILPLATLIGASALAAAWAGRSSRIRWVPTLAVLLVVAGGYSGALYGAILNFDSPSQAMTTMWLLAFGVAIIVGLNATRLWPSLLVVIALASACTGGKASHALVGAGGMILLLVVGFAIRAPWRHRALALSAAAAVAMAVTYLLVLSGVALDQNLTESVAVKASTWQGLDPVDGRLGIALGTISLLLAILARVAGVGWLLGTRGHRTDPSVLFASGGLVVGVAAMLSLSEGINELWFILAASAPASVISAVGVGVALARLHRSAPRVRRPLLWAMGIAVPASVVCALLTVAWPAYTRPVNWLAPLAAWGLAGVGALIAAQVVRGGRTVLVGLAVGAVVLTSIATRPTSAWTSTRVVRTEAGDIQPAPALTPSGSGSSGTDASPPADRYSAWSDAAAWLERNTPSSAIVATSDPGAATVPALSGRVMFIAGEPYQAGLGRSDEIGVAHQRAQDSRAFALAPSAATVAPLCDVGVDYAWLEDPTQGIPDAAIAYDNGTVAIVDVRSWGCPG